MEGLFILVPAIILGLYLLSSIKILSEYERGVIFRLGRLLANAKGPGIILVFGPIDRIVRIDMRQQALEVPPQDIITRDNVTLKVNAVVYWRVMDSRARFQHGPSIPVGLGEKVLEGLILAIRHDFLHALHVLAVGLHQAL